MSDQKGRVLIRLCFCDVSTACTYHCSIRACEEVDTATWKLGDVRGKGGTGSITRHLDAGFTLVVDQRNPGISHNFPGAQSSHPHDGPSKEGCEPCKFYYHLLNHRKEFALYVREGKNVRNTCPSVGASDVVVCHEGWSSSRLQSLLGAAFAEHTLSYGSVETLLS